MEYNNKWQKRSAADTMNVFGSDPAKGLSDKRASLIKKKYGENSIWDPGSVFMFLKRSGGMSLLGYGLMIVASVCAYIFGVSESLFPVIVAVLIGIALTMIMYITAELICVHHSSKWIPLCTVIREGNKIKVSANELVPGDVICLSSGDICPADCKIITSDELYVNEIFSSGRKGSISKKNIDGALANAGDGPVEDFIYAASEIISGECTCVVCVTGKNTLVCSRRGKIVLSAKNDPPALKNIRRNSSGMATVMLIFSFFTVIAGLVCPLSKYSLVELVLICLGLSVSVTDDLLPAAGCFMYALSMSEFSDTGLYLRDINGAEFITGCDGVVVESSDCMKVGKTRLVAAYSAEGGLCDEKQTEDLLSMIYTGTSHGTGKHGNEVLRGIHNFAEKSGKSAEEFFSQTRAHMAVIDSLSTKSMSYTIFSDGSEIMFSAVGSIESVLSMCTRMRTEQGDLPIDREILSSLLESAKKASDEASLLLGIAVRKSPYNSMKRLSVLMSDLTFLGFAALDSFADESLLSELSDLRSKGKKFIMLTDGGGEDINFARRMGIIDGREDIAVSDSDTEKIITEGTGGAILCESSDKISDALKPIRGKKSRYVFVGGDDIVKVGGFTVSSGDKYGKSAAVVIDSDRGVVIPVLRSIKIGEVMEKRFSSLKLCLTVSAFLRGLYALTAVFGSAYVYVSVLLLWSAVIDGALAAALLLRPLKRND